VTIKYKNFEWSFGCSPSDFLGHKNSKLGAHPHFHFQMRINGLRFVDYGDYHFAFIPYDLFILKVKRKEIPGIRYQETLGAGMNDFMNGLLDSRLRGIQSTSNADSASLRMSSVVLADKGTTLSGDEIADLMEESERTGVPKAVLLRRLKNAKVHTIIEPGPGVPEKAIRTPRKRR